MNVTLCSVFRDSTPYLERYIDQVWGLWEILDARDKFCCVWGEGDSTDDTLFQLRHGQRLWPVEIVDCTHGGEKFGSVANPERFRQLAHVGKQIFAAIPAHADVVVYVESDLIWEPATLLALIDRVASGAYPASSPMVFLQRDGWAADAWYDTWGAIGLNGRHFTHHPPYNAGYTPEKPFPVSSMGSCMAMRGDIARRIVVDDRLFQGISAQIWMMGESVWIDPKLTCLHP